MFLSKLKAKSFGINVLRPIRLSVFKRNGSSHGPEGYEPAGYLFGRPPLKPGEKRKWYIWEPIWYFGYYGTLGTWLIYHFFFNDRPTPLEVAKLEAHKRLAEKGEQFDWPLPPDYALVEVHHVENSLKN